MRKKNNQTKKPRANAANNKRTKAAKPEPAASKAGQSAPQKKSGQKTVRTKDGRVPQGRTLKTQDNYLGKGKKTGSEKQRPVVVIEANAQNELVVVPLSSRPGKDRTRLPDYQQGQSYYKHYIEIEDDEGKPIKINQKFKENHPNMDLSQRDTERIKDRVLYHSRHAPENRKKLLHFRNKKSPRN